MSEASDRWGEKQGNQNSDRQKFMQMKDILFDKISQTYYFLGDPRKIGIQIFL